MEEVEGRSDDEEERLVEPRELEEVFVEDLSEVDDVELLEELELELPESLEEPLELEDALLEADDEL